MAATVAAYGLLATGLWWLLDQAAVSSVPWVNSVAHWLEGAALVILLIVLFPSLVAFIIGFFLEEIVTAVEARHYPGLPAPRAPAMGETLVGGARFAVFTIAVNLLALPLYLIPGINLLVFFSLNGYLLGREYFDLVSLRRLDPAVAHGLRRARLPSVWLAGAVIAFFLTIPVVNMFAPIVATAFMVHVFESLRRRQGIEWKSS